MANVADNNRVDTKINKITEELAIRRVKYDVTMNMVIMIMVSTRPDNLLFHVIKGTLKKLMAFPIKTTGCMEVGSSPHRISIKIDSIRINRLTIVL